LGKQPALVGIAEAVSQFERDLAVSPSSASEP
jgi:hypothetical protein